jgi:hypothetical protein
MPWLDSGEKLAYPSKSVRFARIAVIPRPRNWRVKSTFNHLAIGFSVSISTDDI